MTEKRYKEVDVLDNVIYINENIIGYQQLCDLLNEQHERIKTLENEIQDFQDLLATNEEILLTPILITLDDAIMNERTAIGKSVLKQFKEQIQ